jgi:hypothetical protein
MSRQSHWQSWNPRPWPQPHSQRASLETTHGLQRRWFVHSQMCVLVLKERWLLSNFKCVLLCDFVWSFTLALFPLIAPGRLVSPSWRSLAKALISTELYLWAALPLTVTVTSWSAYTKIWELTGREKMEFPKVVRLPRTVWFPRLRHLVKHKDCPGPVCTGPFHTGKHPAHPQRRGRRLWSFSQEKKNYDQKETSLISPYPLLTGRRETFQIETSGGTEQILAWVWAREKSGLGMVPRARPLAFKPSLRRLSREDSSEKIWQVLNNPNPGSAHMRLPMGQELVYDHSASLLHRVTSTLKSHNTAQNAKGMLKVTWWVEKAGGWNLNSGSR